MSTDDIGKLTLHCFDLLLKRHEEQLKKDRLNTGIVAAMIYNTAPFMEKEKAMSPMEFIPGGESSEVDFTQMTPEQQKAYAISTFAKRRVTKR